MCGFVKVWVKILCFSLNATTGTNGVGVIWLWKFHSVHRARLSCYEVVDRLYFWRVDERALHAHRFATAKE